MCEMSKVVLTVLLGITFVCCGVTTYTTHNADKLPSKRVDTLFSPPNAQPRQFPGIYVSFIGLYLSAILGLIATPHKVSELDSGSIALIIICLAVIVLGPPLFYPIAHYIAFQDPNDRDYIKRLGEMWTPFWAAMSALCSAFYFEILKKWFELN
jgi:hypothetical protein